MKTVDLFLNIQSIAKEYIKEYEYPFEILPNIKHIILEIGKYLPEEYQEIKENVWVHKTAKIDSTAQIIGPCIIDAKAKIKPGAWIRENVIVGQNAVIGHCCEVKNAILFDEVKLAHFNYVGDSILGYHTHLGAGSIISNVKSNDRPIKIQQMVMFITKVGAFLADHVEVGCNSVINPGTIIGAYSQIYPLVAVRGVIPTNSILKDTKTIISK